MFFAHLFVPLQRFQDNNNKYVPDVSKDDTQWQQTDKTALQQTGTEGFQRAGAIARRGVTPATF